MPKDFSRPFPQSSVIYFPSTLPSNVPPIFPFSLIFPNSPIPVCPPPTYSVRDGIAMFAPFFPESLILSLALFPRSFLVLRRFLPFLHVTFPVFFPQNVLDAGTNVPLFLLAPASIFSPEALFLLAIFMKPPRVNATFFLPDPHYSHGFAVPFCCSFLFETGRRACLLFPGLRCR